MQRFLIFTKALFLMHLRNGSVLFWNFAFPVLIMLIYGLLMPRFMNYMTSGVIVLAILNFGLVGSSTKMLEMREKGILRRLQATPLSARQLVGAYLIVNLLTGVLQSALVWAVGVVLYRVPVTAVGLAFGLPMILAGMFTFLAMGQIISGVAPKAGVANGMGMMLYFGLMFVSDLIFPLELLPDWLQKVVPVLPTYLVSQLVRPAIVESALDPQWAAHLLLLTVYGGVAALIAARLFRWEPKA